MIWDMGYGIWDMGYGIWNSARVSAHWFVFTLKPKKKKKCVFKAVDK
jgi:hypothetical protein